MLDLLVSYGRTAELSLNGQVKYAIDYMQKCRTHELGGRVLLCPECGARVIHYNPCNKRGCPTCYKKNQIQWLVKAKKRILQTKHYHLTFSIPSHYTQLWQTNRVLVIESLFKAAKAAVSTVGESEGLLLGSVLAFQSHGFGLSYKPHMHCLLSEGGLDASGKYRVLRFVPTKRMQAVFKDEFERNIEAIPLMESEYVMESCKSECYRIYVGIHLENGNSILGYLAKSRNGVVVDIENEVEERDNEIIIREKSSEGFRQICLSPTVFVERYINHIPPDRMVVTRYYGVYSNRHKEEFSKAEAQIATISLEEEEDEFCMELCPVCECELQLYLVFTKDETESMLRICKVHDPPKHGEVILTA